MDLSMNVLEAIKRANQPRPAEHSVPLRLACAATVIVSLAAPASESEMPWSVAIASMLLVTAGMVFSYRTRESPPGWVKLAVAIGAVASLVWFVDRVGSGHVTDITGVEHPLTILFATILIVHCFHVPARRDLVFALGGSAGLMAVAAAQAIDLRFGLLVVVWGGCGLWALTRVWSAASSGGGSRWGTLIAGGAVLSAAAVAFLLLPAPTVAIRVDFQADAGSAGPVGNPGALAGDTGSPVQLSRPGQTSGPARVGGYLGFAGSLDTALRGRLGTTVVMQVRADRPTYWVGETFDTWTDNSWSSRSGLAGQVVLDQGSPFQIPPPRDVALAAGGRGDLQTFYIQNAVADLVFHADDARQVWFPASRLYYGKDGSIVSPIGLGRGAVYTVNSEVASPSPGELRAAEDPAGVDSALVSDYTRLPTSYARVRQLAESITAGATSNYDRAQALIGWIGANTHYSTDIPPLRSGADTVEEFLFGDRTGFCEQISTSLAVMLRTLGIPTREAVGYVPGPYNPITDLYQVRAEDAHAWVQVWFPGYGWQSFDPTAAVPAANPSPGGTALSDAGRFLDRLPWVPIGIVSGTVALSAVLVHVRRRRPTTWAEGAARRMERAGRRAGRPRRPSETIVEYGVVLDRATDSSGKWARLAAAIDGATYGGRVIEPDEGRRLVAATNAARGIRS
ncbi:MAG: DUF4129 domain-containing protein [Acidimicrobiales bacterium]|nr:DUF4129 domain-containing protein [Acidimicrobiales bacterium]